ncbi:hypothetical protein QTI33_07935 [Variovorax sp. J22P271]|uniref:hypothetical protein n=1 Tax=Variovorax davisae TaxID=3053515 RepID=UPI00257498DA|nr:hypothetical protein [Variovorax sp. J22P271]MDM0032071.1 hypothetical protein [Variovorax sp. J22P271]
MNDQSANASSQSRTIIAAVASVFLASCGGGGSSGGAGSLLPTDAAAAMAQPAAATPAAPATTDAATNASPTTAAGVALLNGVKETCNPASSPGYRKDCVEFVLYTPQIVPGSYIGKTAPYDSEPLVTCAVSLDAAGVITATTATRSLRVEPAYGNQPTPNDYWSYLYTQDSYYPQNMMQSYNVANGPSKAQATIAWKGPVVANSAGDWELAAFSKFGIQVSDPGFISCWAMKPQMQVPAPVASPPPISADATDGSGYAVNEGEPAPVTPTTGTPTTTPPPATIRFTSTNALISNGAYNLWRISVGNPNAFGIRCQVIANYQYPDANNPSSVNGSGLLSTQTTRTVTVASGGTGNADFGFTDRNVSPTSYVVRSCAKT